MRKIFALMLSLIYILLSYLSINIIIAYEGLELIQKTVISAVFCLLTIVILFRFIKTQRLRIYKKMTKKQKNKIKTRRISSICGLLVFCIVLSYGNILFNQIDNTLSKITTEDMVDDVTICYAYTLKSSNINNINFASEDTFAVLMDEDGVIKAPFINRLKTQDTIITNDSFNSYSSVVTLYMSLVEGWDDVIIVTESENENFKTVNPSFDDYAKCLGSFELSTYTTSKPVDVKNEPFNVLILGVDVREEEGTIKTDSRADTIIVASFNPVTMNMSLISIPRDTYTLVNGTYDKINHAGTKGMSTMIDSVEKLLDIEINYFAKFNFNALVSLIDALGGINVSVNYEFCEQDSQDRMNSICLAEGVQTLNGEQALAYARHRKSVTDHIRNEAQQIVIKGVTDRLVSFNAVSNVNSILNVLSSNMLTNINKSEIYNLTGLVGSLSNLTYQNYVLTGEDTFEYLYQYEQELAVTYISDDSIATAKNIINSIHNPE